MGLFGIRPNEPKSTTPENILNRVSSSEKSQKNGFQQGMDKKYFDVK